jgi:hypothetical protein
MKAAENKVIDILAAAGVSSLAVGGTSVAYSESFPISGPNDAVAFVYQFDSPGTVKVKLELEQGDAVPETEGAADGSWCVPEDAATFDLECADELIHRKAYPPASSGFGRLKLTGITGNDASTVLTRLKMSVSK